MTKTTGQKRKRESSSESEYELEELEELDGDLNHPWDVESLCGLKMKIKKWRKDVVRPEHHEAFTRLLEDPVVKRFLAWDMNLGYMANDMEEDNQIPKRDIFYFLYGKSYAQRPLFHKMSYQFFCSMSWNTQVSTEQCKEIQAYDPEIWVCRCDRTLIP